MRWGLTSSPRPSHLLSNPPQPHRVTQVSHVPPSPWWDEWKLDEPQGEPGEIDARPGKTPPLRFPNPSQASSPHSFNKHMGSQWHRKERAPIQISGMFPSRRGRILPLRGTVPIWADLKTSCPRQEPAYCGTDLGTSSAKYEHNVQRQQRWLVPRVLMKTVLRNGK